MAIQRFENGPRMSRVVVHNDTVYLAGLTADATVGQSVAEQTKEILAKIDGLLQQGGTDKSKLLQATICCRTSASSTNSTRSGTPGWWRDRRRRAPASRRGCSRRRR